MDCLRKKHAARGNALMEYVLPLLILTGAIVAVTVSPDFNAALKSYFPSANAGVIHDHTLVINSLGTGVHINKNSVPAASQPAAGTTAGSNIPPGGSQQVSLSSGIQVNIPVIAGGGTVTETLGGLGGALTLGLANTFDQMIAQLKAQNADPALIKLITQLSLEGHTIGNTLQTAEGVCKTGNSPDCTGRSAGGVLDDSLFTANSSGKTSTATMVTDQFTKARQAVDNYLKSHPGQYQDVGALIDAEAGQITAITQGVTIQVSNPQKSSFTVTSVSNNATLVHQDANTICANGGNQGVCIQNQTPPASG